jgi:hypothetical protein
MSVGLFLSWLIEPLRSPLIALLPVAIPAAIETSSVTSFLMPFAALLLSWPVTRVAISPALGLVNAFTLRHGAAALVIAFLEPRLRLVSRYSVPSGSISVVSLLLFSMMVSISVTAITIVAIIAISGPPLVPGVEAVASASAHTAMEALGAFMSKTLARLHRTPTVCILVCVATSSIVGVVISPVSKAIIKTILIVRPRAEVEAIDSVSWFCLFEWLFGFAKLVIAQRCSRGEVSPRWSENDVFWVYVVET